MDNPASRTTGEGPHRRAVLKSLAALGAGTAVFRRAVAAEAAQSGAVTPEMIAKAEWIAGLSLTDEERIEVALSVAESLEDFEALRACEVGYDVAPSLQFNPAPGLAPAFGVKRNRAVPIAGPTPDRPADEETLAFLPVAELAALLKARRVTSVELTRLYLGRLKRFDPMLRCVVTLTEKTALEQAERADAEIQAGMYRGPLHGVPWGAKDLVAFPGFPTTWGAPQFRDRVIEEKATVAARLEEAGAVLVAKLSLGALAMGDQWFGGKTRSPWDPRRGSSGSSAGSAAAVAAGLVGFAIGSETHGSIVSPCRACGATGLRPTFGRVSRHGCMSLSWSMDKIGPIARTVEDCALILDAIHGRDGLDPTAVDQPFAWPPTVDLAKVRIGVLDVDETPALEREAAKALRAIGFETVRVELPTRHPPGAIMMMLGVEAAAVFDELTRSRNVEGLNAWPETFRQGEFTPAVEYLRAARARTLLMRDLARLFETVDLFVGGGRDDLAATNLSGHPSVVFPAGFHDRDGRPAPGSIVLTGRLYDESTLLAVARACQEAAGDRRARPPLERFLAEAPKE